MDEEFPRGKRADAHIALSRGIPVAANEVSLDTGIDAVRGIRVVRDLAAYWYMGTPPDLAEGVDELAHALVSHVHCNRARAIVVGNPHTNQADVNPREPNRRPTEVECCTTWRQRK